MTLPGTVVGDRFEVECVAGRGGMSAVYRARDRQRGGLVALKIVDAAHADSRAPRFDREVRVLAELAHPAIVRYLAHGVTERGEPYLAMEWLDGEDLASRLKREPIGARDAVRLVQRVAEAVGIAHARGIVHRDLKPSNLFLVARDVEQVKVLDFGVAHVQADSMTRTGAALGTPSYMAPEQARGQRTIDARADVFSLGCVLFECMAGHPPFVAESSMAVLAKILLEDAPRLASVRADLPAEVDTLVARMLAKDPAQRPRDGAEVARLLGEIGAITAGAAPERARDSAVTVGEQRLACVVLAADAIALDSTTAPSGDDATMQEATAPTLASVATPTTRPDIPNSSRLLSLRAAAVAHGGRAEVLADGSVVVTLLGHGAATDQAARAARCALAVRNVLGDVAMALAIGQCPVQDPAPIGELLDRAARMLRAPVVATAATAIYAVQTGARPIRVDDTAAGLLDARFAIDGDTLGLALVGERDVAAPARTLLGRQTPFVGRERELAALLATFEECIAEPMAHVVLVTAPVGVGKSRLRHELLARLAERDVEVWIGNGEVMNPGAPFGMLARSLRRAAGITDGEPPQVRHMKLRARVMRHLAGDDAARVTEFVGELVDAPVLDEGSVRLRAARRDPQLMSDQTLRACEDFVAAECSARPLLLVLEDLHWGDLPTVRFVDSALRQLPDRPLMVLAFARPEVDALFPRLWADRHVQRISLGELTRRAATKLVRDALGDALDEAAVAQLVERSAGNAFYLEELIRAVATGKRDRLPDTVIAMAQTRIEELEVEARQVLRAASIFGDTFWQQGVEALLEASAPRVDVWLTELVARELVVEHRESRFAGQRQYGFRHALVREAAYAMLPERDRVRGHLIVGNWLEQRGGEIDAVALAEHFERGGEPARSVAWYRRAAEHALESNDLASAIERAERAIAASTSNSPDVIGPLRLLQADAHNWRDEYVLAIDRGEIALAQLPTGSPRWLAAAAAVVHACARRLEADRVVELCQALAAISLAPAMYRDFARAVSVAASTLLWRDDGDLVAALYTKLDHIAVYAAGDPSALAHVGLARAWRAFHAGDFAESYRLDLETEQCHIAVGDLRQAAQQRANVGYDEMQLGAYALAERSLTDAIAMAERMGLAQVINQARHNLGLVLARQGRIDEARAVETLARDAFAAQDAHRLASASRNYLAIIETIAGNYAAAVELAREAIDTTGDAPGLRCQFHATLARAYHLGGDVESALAHARTAARMLEEHGRPEEGEIDIYLAYAEILAATGAHEHARRTLATAVHRVQEAASRIGDVRWRDSFVRAVPEHARTLELARAWRIA